ncbi:MAG: hypothetical protein AAFR98_11870 [Pseudomonadota bacterium]
MKYLALVTALAASPVVAQTPCLPRDVALEHLAADYAESRQSVALAADGSLIEVFASEAGTWTLTRTQPGGPMCLLAAGESYQYVNEPLPPMGQEG